jgi:hypothetical protein
MLTSPNGEGSSWACAVKEMMERRQRIRVAGFMYIGAAGCAGGYAIIRKEKGLGKAYNFCYVA